MPATEDGSLQARAQPLQRVQAAGLLASHNSEESSVTSGGLTDTPSKANHRKRRAVQSEQLEWAVRLQSCMLPSSCHAQREAGFNSMGKTVWAKIPGHMTAASNAISALHVAATSVAQQLVIEGGCAGAWGNARCQGRVRAAAAQPCPRLPL